jgi:4-hydroxy-tetrahydrodipicolinate synthase
MVTPFDDDGRVNVAKFRQLASYLVENGSDGVVVTGTTGEAPTLTDEERFQLYEAAVAEVGDRATVIAGTGTYDTAHSIHLTQRADAIGVDGVLIVTPYYSKPTPRGIVEHFKAIAAVTDKPVIVYNIPARVVINIEPETMCELAEIPNVTAVKQANADLDQARTILAETDLDLYAGDDDLILPFLELGGMGGVCVHTHVVGPPVKELIRRWRQAARGRDRAGDRDPARGHEPDRDQGGAEPARARGRRSPSAARRGRRSRAHRDSRLPRAARPASARRCIAAAARARGRARSGWRAGSGRRVLREAAVTRSRGIRRALPSRAEAAPRGARPVSRDRRSRPRRRPRSSRRGARAS